MTDSIDPNEEPSREQHESISDEQPDKVVESKLPGQAASLPTTEIEMTVDSLEFDESAFKKALAVLVGHRELDVTLSVAPVDKFSDFRTFRRRIVRIQGDAPTLSRIIEAIQQEDTAAPRTKFTDDTGAVSLGWISPDGRSHHVQLRRLLFLSHAGADSESAEQLVDLIQKTEEAQKRGLKVWFDKRDLKSGLPWMDQLDEAIQRSTAFAMYVGTRGVVKWVHAEVQRALMRSEVETGFVFIPILNGNDPETLPGFVQRYQGIHFDVVHEYKHAANSTPLTDLIQAVLQSEVRPVLEGEPYVGLQPFDEEKAHLFFGRRKETQELVDILRGRERRLVMVVGDSGSGKSSLVRAGLVSAYRCGALTDPNRTDPDESIWHVVKTRPRKNPFGSLADDLQDAATEVNIRIAPESKSIVRRGNDPQAVYDVIRDAAPKDAQILLVVDQFEELFTQSNPETQKSYVETLMYLSADPGNTIIRVVITMRHDYYNQCRRFRELNKRIEDSEAGAKFSVKKMDDEGLRDCITEPLKLAGLDSHSYEVFAKKVLSDISEQPGELPLLQMALSESWKRKAQFNGDLLDAYISVGGVPGALATVADEIFDRKDLSEAEKEQAEIVFLRLAQLGDTGGVTKRISSRDELSDDQWDLLQKMATEDFGRLVFIGGGEDRIDSAEQEAADVDATDDVPEKSHSEPRSTDEGLTVELAHDALITQWPRYLDWLQRNAKLKRLHDNVIPDAKKWEASNRHKGDLLGDNRLLDAKTLKEEHPEWLSHSETEFIDHSNAVAAAKVEEEKAREKEKLEWLEQQARSAVLLKRLAIGLAALLLVAIALGILSLRQTHVANEQRTLAQKGFRTALSAVKDVMLEVSDSILLNQPSMQPVQLQIFRRASGYLDSFLKNDAWKGREDLQDQRAVAYYGMARFQFLQGDSQQALKSLSAARSIQEQLLEDNSDDLELLLDLTNTYNLIGTLQEDHLGDFAEAAQSYKKSLDFRTRLVELSPRSEFKRKKANAQMNLAVAIFQQDKQDSSSRALDAHQKAQDIRIALVEPDAEPDPDWLERKLLPPHIFVIRDLARGYFHIGQIHNKRGLEHSDNGDKEAAVRECAEAVSALEKARIRAEEAFEAYPIDVELQSVLGNVLTQLGEYKMVLNRPDRWKAAKDDLDLAQETLEALVKSNRVVVEYRRDLALAYNAKGNFHYDDGMSQVKSSKPERAKEAFKLAVEKREQQEKTLRFLVKKRPDNATYHYDLGLATVSKIAAMKEMDVLNRQFPSEQIEAEKQSLEKFLADCDRFNQPDLFDQLRDNLKTVFPCN